MKTIQKYKKTNKNDKVHNKKLNYTNYFIKIKSENVKIKAYSKYLKNYISKKNTE